MATFDTSSDPTFLPPSDRLDEVAKILALGIRRLLAREVAEKARKRSGLAETDLDFAGPESVSGLETEVRGDRR